MFKPRLVVAVAWMSVACHHGSSGGTRQNEDAAVGPRDAGRDASTRPVDGGLVRDAGGGAVDASAATDASGGDRPGDASSNAVTLPPVGGKLDYQLGGPYAPPAGVGIVSRDRTAAIAPGLYNICYVNGFQVQPEEEDLWLRMHPTLILRDRDGKPVIDRDWDEMLLDVSTEQKRAGLLEVVGGWIDGCAKAGFDAVEVDNLDSFSRSGNLLKEEHAIAFLALLSARAHQHGLAIAQKNSSELVGRRARLGTDFVVAEECSRYDECDVYIDAYGPNVLMIEYRREDFRKGCGRYPDYPIVLRDLNLTKPGSSNYVFEDC